MTLRSTSVIVHLSGPLRGTTRKLAGANLRLGADPRADIHLPGERQAVVGATHATLLTTDAGYTLRAAPEHRVWVNGQLVEEQALASGDLVELGEGGPLLRFRVYPPGQRVLKSMRQALADCYEAARRGSESRLGRIWLFVVGGLRELLTQVSPWTRAAVVGLLILLLASVAVLGIRGDRLEQELEAESRQRQALQALLDAAEPDRSLEELEKLRRQLETRIASTAERLDFLEELAGAAQRTVAEAARSVVFLQGSYGFREPRTLRPLRFAMGPDDQVATDSRGNPRFSTEGSGPLVEAYFTGTGFVVSDDGLVLTNRHVALPWEFDQQARQVSDQGLEPFQVRLIGYVTGLVEPFELELVLASGAADLALLACSDASRDLRPLALARVQPSQGEPVIVLGFPTGIQAMMARADRDFLDTVGGQQLDFWQIAERLSAAGQIGPLATRGIVGQVTASSVVYDAETTSGGSGGPVLNLEGRVVAINSAILTQFDGSNLGVPSRLAADLLSRAAELTGRDSHARSSD